MLKPIGSYILVKPTHHIISANEFIGLVVGSGETVNPDRVKVGDYIRFNPMFGANISYKGEHLILLIDEHLFVENLFVVIEDLQSLLGDKLCGGSNIVSLVANERDTQACQRHFQNHDQAHL